MPEVSGPERKVAEADEYLRQLADREEEINHVKFKE